MPCRSHLHAFGSRLLPARLLAVVLFWALLLGLLWIGDTKHPPDLLFTAVIVLAAAYLKTSWEVGALP